MEQKQRNLLFVWAAPCTAAVVDAVSGVTLTKAQIDQGEKTLTELCSDLRGLSGC